jgi:hypothetical protein
MVRHHHRIALAVALIAALAAAAPASAKPGPYQRLTSVELSTPASTNLCSEVCSGRGYTAGASGPVASAELGAKLPHDPTSRAQLLIAANAIRPVAHASSTGPRSEVVSGGGYGNPSAASTIVRVVAPAPGFHWGDAGIGAGGAIATLLLLAGGFVAVSSIRSRTAQTAAHRTT